MIGRRFVQNQSKTLAIAAAALALHGCGSQEPGGVEGQLLIGTTDPEEGDVQSIYYLHVPEGAGSDPELVFTKNPYLTAGTKLRARQPDGSALGRVRRRGLRKPVSGVDCARTRRTRPDGADPPRDRSVRSRGVHAGRVGKSRAAAALAFDAHRRRLGRSVQRAGGAARR